MNDYLANDLVNPDECVCGRVEGNNHEASGLIIPITTDLLRDGGGGGGGVLCR